MLQGYTESACMEKNLAKLLPDGTSDEHKSVMRPPQEAGGLVGHQRGR